MPRLTGAALTALVLLPLGPSQAAEVAPGGTWKLSLPLGGARPLWIVKFESKDGKWTGSVVSTRQGVPAGKLDKLAVTKDALRFTMGIQGAPGIPFERPSDDAVDRFAKVLAGHHVTVSVRKSRGRDIRAACGQLIVEGPGRSPAQELARVIEMQNEE